VTYFQPKALPIKTQERVTAQNNVLFGALGNIGLAVLVIIIIVKINHEETLRAFDLYPNMHKPMSQEQRITNLWKTSLGGMFSICGIIFGKHPCAWPPFRWLETHACSC
jgi:hypothetical protein